LLEKIHAKYAGHAEFLTVYIKEAHPTDEWHMKVNEKDDVCYAQPKTLRDRVAIANDFKERFQYKLPLLVDPIENPANAAFAAWPERLYIIDEKGIIVYKGKPGPFGYKPDEVAQWLERRFSRT
jgi:hypothetical protein